MPDQGGMIFGEPIDGKPSRPRRSLPASLAIHAVLLVALFRGRSPIFVAPSSVLGGANGTSVTHLYWAAGFDAAESKASGSASRPRSASETHLAWQRAQKSKSDLTREHQGVEVADRHEAPDSAANPAASAGSPYGSLSEGADAGHEVRPALPSVTSEPLVGADDLRGGAEGNVVIEITIDEAGNIVSKNVVQSLGPAIDGKVLAALENWHFHPATRDGVPIPSKQDVVYHFKPR
jgi:TonB family protein